MRHLAFLLLLVVTAPALARAQQTLRESVLTMGVSEEVVVVDYPDLPLRELTSNAGAVLHVTIRHADAFLSSDGTVMLTDYRATVLDVLKGRADSRVTVGDVITVRRRGGAMNIDGRSVYSTESGFPAFGSGNEYVLFLDTDAGQPFALVAGPQSVFRVHEGTVAQWPVRRSRRPRFSCRSSFRMFAQCSRRGPTRRRSGKIQDRRCGILAGERPVLPGAMRTHAKRAPGC